jgi:cell division protease FtsH
MAEALIKYETIDTEQIKDIMEGREPRPPEGWTDSGPGAGSGESPVDDGETDAASNKGSQGSGPKSGEIGGPASQH